METKALGRNAHETFFYILESMSISLEESQLSPSLLHGSYKLHCWHPIAVQNFVFYMW